jgi:hypothetical protein
LKNPSLVFEKLNETNFDQPETLNFDLLAFLLEANKNEFAKQIIDQIQKGKRLDFVSQFLTIEKQKHHFTELLQNGISQYKSKELKHQKTPIFIVLSYHILFFKN